MLLNPPKHFILIPLTPLATISFSLHVFFIFKCPSPRLLHDSSEISLCISSFSPCLLLTSGFPSDRLSDTNGLSAGSVDEEQVEAAGFHCSYRRMPFVDPLDAHHLSGQSKVG
eukprot:TRINITY_DN6730_c0_g2_i6.p1 TRINITY_DN6730_c0_g2~~TRINITY_DN6730_c0_g2_i6.p1  ORF type:complete len:113 (-),score=16.65 TRINITY_DN6730_c0_g2_i6:753-1091(-)